MQTVLCLNIKPFLVQSLVIHVKVIFSEEQAYDNLMVVLKDFLNVITVF